MTTIISAFQRTGKYRNLDFYIENGKKLLNVNNPKVVFIEEEIYNEYFRSIEFPLTKFILFEKTNNYLNDFQLEEKVETDNKLKDTIDYFKIICHKTEWVKIACESNIFNTNNFIWVDFGIDYILKNNYNLEELIKNMCNKEYKNLVRIAGGYNRDFGPYKINWNFLGGIFGGEKNTLINFADIMKKETLDFIKKTNSLIWEVNIWTMIEKKYFIFSKYPADHNATMFKNY